MYINIYNYNIDTLKNVILDTLSLIIKKIDIRDSSCR